MTMGGVGRARAEGHRSVLVGVAALALILSASCSTQVPPSVQGVPGASATPAESPTPSVAIGQLATSDAEIRFQVALDHDRVPSGTAVTATVTVTNVGARSITYAANGCGVPAVLELVVPIPNDSAGISQTGPNGRFKRYLLSEGNGLGVGSVLSPVTDPFGPGCQSPPQDLAIGPGQIVTGSATWTANIAGVPAPPAAIGVNAQFSYDPLPPPSFGLESPFGIIPSWIEQYQHHISLTGSFQVIAAGTQPRLLAAGEAIDAALRVPVFAAWLARQPEPSWSVGNLYLDTGGWHVELFAGQATFAYVIIDPVSGKLRSMRICSPATCKF